MHPLRIHSIRIVENNKKYQSFFHALWLFDVIITGSESIFYIKRGDITKRDVLILEKLVKSKINKAKERIDPFIVDCFALYCLNKQHIELNMEWIYARIYQGNDCKLSFLFYQLKDLWISAR